MGKQGIFSSYEEDEVQLTFKPFQDSPGHSDLADAISLAQTQRSLTSRSGAQRMNSYLTSQPLQRRFKSARLVGEYEKPWLEDKSFLVRERADKIILGVCAFVGFVIAGFICWNQWNQLPKHSV
jgi:hypothetical protein